ncbi:MAG TPA: hypothetical protein VMU24_12160 [Candidatus Acidoferrales bacterium]|nr:hypothetical protein [Candidatus Acidoferrales bacterium]
MKKILLGALSLLIATAGFAQVNVSASSPTSSSTSPVKVSANASSSHPIAGWHVYVDGKDSYVGPASGSINTTISTGTGTHQFVIRAWDSTGAYGDKTINVNVTSGSTPSNSVLAVKVNAPTPSSSVPSPFGLNATASGPKAIAGWHVYVDGKDSYVGGATSTISTNLSASAGSHTIVVRAWDSTGAYADQTLGVTVSGSSSNGGGTDTSALPNPPSTAKVYNKIEEMTSGWNSCGTASCAGGTGAGSFWMALNQSNPSMDGRSMEIYRDGKWANALWWHSMGANDSATNMLWDFYIMTDSAALSNAQALEYDAYQFVSGWNYMIGTECNYAAGVWDTWNENSQQWLHTSVPCPKFSANQWHHIQMYLTLNHSNHTYTYRTFVIDGKVYNLNQTQPAKYLGWSDNIGAQWQLDVNAGGGGFHEWIDNAKLTVW